MWHIHNEELGFFFMACEIFLCIDISNYFCKFAPVKTIMEWKGNILLGNYFSQRSQTWASNMRLTMVKSSGSITKEWGLMRKKTRTAGMSLLSI
jgi:hypothetical protein